MANEAGARGYWPPHLRKTVDTRHSLVLGVICSFEYELDATGNRLSVKDKSGKYTPYQYDPMQQLKAENRWSAKTPGTRSYQYAYAYDPNGNRIEEWHDGVRTTYTYGDNNEMLTAGGTSFTYDQFGNTLTNGSATYHWDDDSHLTSATGISFLTDTFTYDGDSRRMSASWSGSVIPVRFIYDELSSGYPAVIAEYTLSGSTFAIGAVYTHGLGLISSNRGGTQRYFHYDGLGSTHALTDSTGATTDTYTYSAFGVQESSTGSSVNPYRYVGELGYYNDFGRGSNYGLHCVGRRFYAADVAKFIARDRLPEEHPYNYCENNPISYSDPGGSKPTCVQWQLQFRALVLGEDAGYTYSCTSHSTKRCTGRLTCSCTTECSGHFTFDSRNGSLVWDDAPCKTNCSKCAGPTTVRQLLDYRKGCTSRKLTLERWLRSFGGDVAGTFNLRLHFKVYQ